MFNWFRSLFDRHQARHVDSGLDFEASLVARMAERKAQLLRRAAMYETEGLPTIAADVRACAEAISFDRPLSSVLLPTKIYPEAPATSANGTATKVPARK